MSRQRTGLLLGCVLTMTAAMGSRAGATDGGVHCRIDSASFDGDPDLTRIDYVVPPGGKAPRFRLLSGHLDDAGAISVELKARGELAVGAAPLSLEATWRSVLKMPKRPDSVVSEGTFQFTHFEPAGDAMAVGTVQFKTADAHQGECRFSLHMEVVDLDHSLR